MRLIDNPGVQLPPMLGISKSVLVELLWSAAREKAIDAEPDSEVPMRIADLAQAVESGELVSLTAAEWTASNGESD